MSAIAGVLFVFTWAALGFTAWVAYNLLRQNGRTLLRIDALEAEIERLVVNSEAPSAKGNGDRSLARSRINRNGLRPGTIAPAFTLPRVDGGELSLSDYAGRRVLLVFSDPDCGPCDLLAPKLEWFSRTTPDVSVLMVSRGDPERNRRKVAEHGLTFPVVLQHKWKLSREYAMFATPIGYLIDEDGRVGADVAVGMDAILDLPALAAVLVSSRR